MHKTPPHSRWRPHPWHGIDVGPEPPRVVNAYIEITPFDAVKYEVDKATGYLMVDRPQRSSSLPPALYGYIPRTYCDDRVGALTPGVGNGDGDPLDICVISERPINRSEVIVRARVVGGLQMIDDGEADDKIIAVLENDNLLSGVTKLDELPWVLVERLWHYFISYKMVPGQEMTAAVDHVYDADHAEKVIEAAILDYQDEFGEYIVPRGRMT